MEDIDLLSYFTDTVWPELQGIVSSIWEFNIATIDNNPITVANILIAVFAFVIGIIVSRRLSRVVNDRLLSHTAMDLNSRAALQSVTFYILVLIFLLFSLDIAQIPIKIFALLGGALAIGIGFGSQYLIKDFMNGLVLMIAQPVRVGDMIELQDREMTGRVKRIGALATHIVTFRNVDILVPNSALIEGTVINWTLSSNTARRILSIGVAYGTDTKKVEEIILQAAQDEPAVFDSPEPKVYFVDFAESTLNFELFYWIKMTRPGDERSVASDLRHRITQLFYDNDITIAFPQRDVHLDTTAPIEVKVSK